MGSGCSAAVCHKKAVRGNRARNADSTVNSTDSERSPSQG